VTPTEYLRSCTNNEIMALARRANVYSVDDLIYKMTPSTEPYNMPLFNVEKLSVFQGMKWALRPVNNPLAPPYKYVQWRYLYDWEEVLRMDDCKDVFAVLAAAHATFPITVDELRNMQSSYATFGADPRQGRAWVVCPFLDYEAHASMVANRPPPEYPRPRRRGSADLGPGNFVEAMMDAAETLRSLSPARAATRRTTTVREIPVPPPEPVDEKPEIIDISPTRKLRLR